MKAAAPLAAKTDKVDARLLAELGRTWPDAAASLREGMAILDAQPNHDRAEVAEPVPV